MILAWASPFKEKKDKEISIFIKNEGNSALSLSDSVSLTLRDND